MKINRSLSFSLIEIMVVVVIIVILVAVALPNQLRARINASQESAKNILKVISSACESYATTHNGTFPTTADDLIGGSFPFLNKNYCQGGPYTHYTFNCAGMATNGYTIIAQPAIDGAVIYSITTGAVTSWTD